MAATATVFFADGFRRKRRRSGVTTRPAPGGKIMHGAPHHLYWVFKQLMPALSHYDRNYHLWSSVAKLSDSDGW